MEFEGLTKKRHLLNAFAKEACFTTIIVLSNFMVGASRSYLPFFLHQLDFPNSAIIVDIEQKSWIATCSGILGPIGCVLSGRIMDLWGRKVYLFSLVMPIAISWLVIGFSSSYIWLILGILVQGLGTGMVFCVSTYISEVTNASHRGPLLGGLQVSYNIGVLLSAILMYNFSWKTVAFIYALSSFGYMLLLSYLPESPIWLYSKGKYEESVNTLCRIRCAEREHLNSEIKEIENFCGIQEEKNWRAVMKKCFKARRIFIIIAILLALLHHSGYSVMMAYTITIFDNLKIPFNSSWIAVLFFISSFFGSILAPYCIYRVNKKTILSITAFAMGACMFVVAVYGEIFNSDKPCVWVIPVVLCTYGFVSNLGALPIAFTIGGEVFPQEISGTMNGLYGLFGYIYWTIILKNYPKLMFYCGVKSMIWGFSISCFMMSLYSIFVLPETKGKSLNQVQEQYLRKKKNVMNTTA